MSENNLAQNNNLPEKSNLWLASNIAAGALLANIVVKFIGEMIFGQFILENFVLRLIYTIVIILIGAYLGSKFGVQYAVKQSIINPDKIDSISKSTAVIPFLFLLIVIIQNIYVSSSGMEKFEFPFFDLIGTLIFTLSIFYFCKKFLLEFVGKIPQVDQLANNTVSVSSKNDNVVKILIGFIILAIIGISIFFVWKLSKKDITSVSSVITPNTTINPLAVTPLPVSVLDDKAANWKIFKDEETGFEFKYPQEWIFSAQPKDGKLGFLDIHLENFQYSDDNSICDPNFIGLEIQAGVPKDQSQDFYSFVKSQIVEGGLGPKGSLKEVKVNDHFGFMVQDSGWDSNCSGPGYFIEQDRNFYIYVFTGIGKDSQNEGLEKIDQIISTFISIENNDISDWKIYNTEKSWQFPSEKYTIKYPADWSYSEKRIAGERNSGNLETTFQNNKNEKIVKIVAGGILSNYQDNKYTNKGEVGIGSLNYKFLKLEETSLGNVIYVFDTGENMLTDSTQKGYDEVIVFSADFINGDYLNEMVSTFEFDK